jgi:chemotaxis protein methyltransferase CheR
MVQAGLRTPAVLDEAEFTSFRTLFRELVGISLSEQKKALVASRLAPRVRDLGLASYGEYHRILKDPAQRDELQTAIDLITTNETYFFREPEHFRILEAYVKSRRPVPAPFRVWSAASSSGEEAYSIAMVLAGLLGAGAWNVHGTDVSTRVLARARQGLYSMERTSGIPEGLLRAHCLKGQGKQEGMLMMDRPLMDRVTFSHANLVKPIDSLGPFDVAFLRNVLIYFEAPQKRRIVETVVAQLKPGGLLIVGHAESLMGMAHGLTPVRPTVYRVP